MKRTDIHRPGAIIPANYTHVLFYHGPISGMYPVAPFNVNKAVELKRTEKFAVTGSIFNCSVCGAHFNEGEIWKHNETQEHIYVGRICAEKYGLMTDRSEYELELGRQKEASAKVIQAKINAEHREAFLKNYPGLEEALAVKHHIIEDIAKGFQKYCSLSTAQMDLVFKLAHEVANPKEAEKHVTAPQGRVTFRGTVVSTKTYDSMFGQQLKMMVKVTTLDGTWLAWGTAPTIRRPGPRLHSTDGIILIDKGMELEITATLSAGREPHFALMGRPKAKVIEAQEVV